MEQKYWERSISAGSYDDIFLLGGMPLLACCSASWLVFGYTQYAAKWDRPSGVVGRYQNVCMSVFVYVGH